MTKKFGIYNTRSWNYIKRDMEVKPAVKWEKGVYVTGTDNQEFHAYYGSRLIGPKALSNWSS